MMGMQTEEDAVRWLQEHGLFAETRDWSEGQAVYIWSSQEAVFEPPITLYRNMMVIYREDGDWYLVDPSYQINDTKRCDSLAAAGMEAAERLALKSR